MKTYYLRFNNLTQKVDIFSSANGSLIQSVKVINGLVPSRDVAQISFALNISEKNQIENLKYEIYCEYRYKHQNL